MPRNNNQDTEYVKPRFTVYTMMLLLSFLFLALGSLLLYWELQPYGDFFKWWQTSGV